MRLIALESPARQCNRQSGKSIALGLMKSELTKGHPSHTAKTPVGCYNVWNEASSLFDKGTEKKPSYTAGRTL